MKGWGKSPPHGWQQAWHGKPHREQDRIGAARSAHRLTAMKRPGLFPDPRPGLVARGALQKAPQMNGHHLALSEAQNPAYRPGGSLGPA